MRYYVDTAVWVALLDETHFAHWNAKRFFSKVAHDVIVVSFSHVLEMRKHGFEKRFERALKSFCVEGVKQTDVERRAAFELNSRMRVGYGDCLHVYCAKKAGATAVSPDKHWQKLGSVIGVGVLRPTDFT